MDAKFLSGILQEVADGNTTVDGLIEETEKRLTALRGLRSTLKAASDKAANGKPRKGRKAAEAATT